MSMTNASNGSRIGDIAHAVQVVGVGKERHTLISQRGYLKRQHSNATRATMGPMALCQRTFGGDAIGT